MRLQLDLSEERVEALDRLMEETDLSTRKELFNNALSLFEWAVKEVRNGNVIASVNENEGRYRELHIPALSVAAAKGARREKNNKGLTRAARVANFAT